MPCWQSGLVACGLALIGLMGCASHVDRLHPVRTEFYSGRLPEARIEVDKLARKHSEDRDVFELDRAMIELCAGNPKESEKILRGVRDRFDKYEKKSAKELAEAMLTDDTKIAYAGEDHEKILIRTFLTLSNLMADGQDADAYALQIGAKQAELTAKLTKDHEELRKKAETAPAPPELPQVALGPYIQAMLHEETATDASEVVRAREMVVSYVPGFRDGQADLDRAMGDNDIPLDHGAIYVFTLVGRGPTKEESEDIPTQVALLIADQIVSAVAKQTVPPTLAPIKVAKVVRRHNRVQSVHVHLDGQSEGSTTTLVDVGQLAVSHYEAHYHEVIARAVARRAIKKGAVYIAKESLHAESNPVADIALTLGGIAWEATEAPDTRCWGLLPDKIQVCRIVAPVGTHQLQLQSADTHGIYGIPASISVDVHDGSNTYVMASFPDDRIVGKALVSGVDTE
ncbi:MAG: hypothetical protein DWH91_16890 [Planctomycetota bacterium]|nr:MAG: hypothetical protein DWH91_16890 [Planctomycetota bacterium]